MFLDSHYRICGDLLSVVAITGYERWRLYLIVTPFILGDAESILLRLNDHSPIMDYPHRKHLSPLPSTTATFLLLDLCTFHT